MVAEAGAGTDEPGAATDTDEPGAVTDTDEPGAVTDTDELGAVTDTAGQVCSGTSAAAAAVDHLRIQSWVTETIIQLLNKHLQVFILIYSLSLTLTKLNLICIDLLT